MSREPYLAQEAGKEGAKPFFASKNIHTNLDEHRKSLLSVKDIEASARYDGDPINSEMDKWLKGL